MANFLQDNDDLRFYIDRWIDWDPVVRATENDFQLPDGFTSTEEAVDSYRAILDAIGNFVADEIAPHEATIDREGVRFEDGEATFPPTLQSIFDQLKALALHGLCIPRELGGQNAPALLYFITTELMGRADVSVLSHFGFHGGIALAMILYSAREGTTKVDPVTGAIVETRFREFIEEIIRGDAWGSMDITEPDAGSDMARLRAVGEQDEDGNWYVTGQKIFITSGHGKFHFVIARTEKAESEDDPFAGLKGLSMFLVPAYRDEEDGTRTRIVNMGRIEEKLGHHASVTAELNYERAPAFLVGKRGQGFEYMLTLMNNARVGVGFECLGLCESAVRLAEDYAKDRKSMGKTIDQHEMIADYFDEMKTDIKGLRALCMHGAYHEEMSQKLQLQLSLRAPSDEKELADLKRRIKRHKREARRVTPLLKYFGAEKAVEHSRRSLQIHGGVGYTTEYGAEKLLRDALVMPIYEGTSQIQALMAMKDTLGGILKNPQSFLRRGARARWRALSSRDALERRVAQLQVQSFNAQQHLVFRIAGDKLKSVQGKPISEWREGLLGSWDPKRDFSYAMLHAERLIQVLIDESVAKLLLAQAKKFPERVEVLEAWLERAEPRTRFLVDEITNTGDRLLRRLNGTEQAEEIAGRAAS